MATAWRTVLVLALLALAGCGRDGVPTASKSSTANPSPATQSESELAAAEQEALKIIRETGGAFVFGGKDGRPLFISLTGWPPQAIERLGAIRNLAKLNICSGDTSKAGLAAVAKLNSVRSLDLSCPTTDADMLTLRAMTGLEALSLNSSEITDRGLATIQSLPNLKSVKLGQCLNVTKAGLKRLGDSGIKVESSGE